MSLAYVRHPAFACPQHRRPGRGAPAVKLTHVKLRHQRAEASFKRRTLTHAKDQLLAPARRAVILRGTVRPRC